MTIDSWRPAWSWVYYQMSLHDSVILPKSYREVYE